MLFFFSSPRALDFYEMGAEWTKYGLPRGEEGHTVGGARSVGMMFR